MRTVSPQAGRPRPGFTLVEVLTVIVILSILASLLVGAVIMVRLRARETVLRMEISQLQMALEKYKSEFGEYPPDFWGLTSSNGDIQTAARNEVSRHILKRFPQYDYSGQGDPYLQMRYDLSQPVASGGYGISVTDVDHFDPATALAFWLGGLPEGQNAPYASGYDISDRSPAGFFQDPQHPFRQGSPRTKPHYDGFKSAQFVWAETHAVDSTTRYMRLYPARMNVPVAEGTNLPTVIDSSSPYAYFKARRVGPRFEYGYADASSYASATMIVPAFYVHGTQSGSPANANVAVPYLDAYDTEPKAAPFWDNSSNAPPASNAATAAGLASPHYIRRWRDREKYQIICAGLDGQYGSLGSATNLWTSPLDAGRFRFKTGQNFSAEGGDYDNLSSFSEKTIESEMK